MLQLVVSRYLTEQQQGDAAANIDAKKKVEVLESLTLPELEVTPDIGLLHPLLEGYASHPKSCEFLILFTSRGFASFLFIDEILIFFLSLPTQTQIWNGDYHLQPPTWQNNANLH